MQAYQSRSCHIDNNRELCFKSTSKPFLFNNLHELLNVIDQNQFTFFRI